MAFDDCGFDPEQFNGRVRLFPLPNLVVFPHVMQPLHIFEPRYREMFEESLADDRLIAMAVLAPGWEQDYEGRPAIRRTGCLCRIATHHKTDKGTYNALLLGLRRIKIARELPPIRSFREAEVRLIEDRYPPHAAPQRAALQRQLVEAFRSELPKAAAAPEQLEQLLSSEISLGMLTDIVAYTLNVKQRVKEQLLSQPVPDARAVMLLKCLTGARRAAKRQTFPPAFSLN